LLLKLGFCYGELPNARIILTMEKTHLRLPKIPNAMSNPIARRALVVLATLLLLTVSTTALAHGHPHAKSVSDSDCAMVHGGA
jgi:hypothetical protein